MENCKVDRYQTCLPQDRWQDTPRTSKSPLLRVSWQLLVHNLLHHNKNKNHLMTTMCSLVVFSADVSVRIAIAFWCCQASFLLLTWQGPSMWENDHLTNQNGRRSQCFDPSTRGISIWTQNTWIIIKATIVMINFRWTIAVPIFVQGLAVCLAPYLLLLEKWNV